VSSVIRSLLYGVAAIAGFVAVWSLAGVVAVIAYRQDQITQQACLADAPLPDGLGTGAVAIIVTLVSLAPTLLSARALHRKAAVWASVLFLAVTLPLLASATIMHTRTEQPHTISRDACIGDDRSEGAS